MLDSLCYRRPTAPCEAPTKDGKKDGKFRVEVILSGDFDPRTKGIPDRLKFDRCVKDQLMWPLRLKDFMNFLRFDEHSAENLKFYLWYMDYSARWEKLSDQEKVGSPEWSKDTWKEKLSSVKDHHDVIVTNTDLNNNTTPLPSKESFDSQPFRPEIQRIISIFLLPNSPLELNLTNWERTQTLEALSHTTSPSAFLPILQAVEYTLRVQSYVNFIIRQLSLGKRNKWRSRIGYIVFTFTFIVALTTAILLILSPFNKAWRLLPAGVLWYGVLAYCSGHRGICALLFVQRATLIDPWDDPEEFATSSVRISKHGRSKSQSAAEVRNKDEESHAKSYRIAAGGTSDGLKKPANSVAPRSRSDSSSAFEVYFDDFDVKKAQERLEDWNARVPLWRKAFAMNPRVKEKGLRKLQVVMFIQHSIFATLCMGVYLVVVMPFPGYGKLFK